MAREGDNGDDEYYVPIQTISVERIVKTNRVGQASAIALGLLTCQCNAFLQTSIPGSIETTKNELADILIFKATMYHMDLIICNSDNGYIHLAYPIFLADETSQKDNLHQGESMKDDDRADFIKNQQKNK